MSHSGSSLSAAIARGIRVDASRVPDAVVAAHLEAKAHRRLVRRLDRWRRLHRIR